jgi:hypothetical protein
MNLLSNLRQRIEDLFGKEKFDTGKFLELVSEFEIKLKEELQFELLQLYYAPYSFGSGHVVYRIKGRNIQILYDGRDKAVDVSYSKPHAKFPSDGWEQTQTYPIQSFWETGVKDILQKAK